MGKAFDACADWIIQGLDGFPFFSLPFSPLFRLIKVNITVLSRQSSELKASIFIIILQESLVLTLDNGSVDALHSSAQWSQQTEKARIQRGIVELAGYQHLERKRLGSSYPLEDTLLILVRSPAARGELFVGSTQRGQYGYYVK